MVCQKILEVTRRAWLENEQRANLAKHEASNFMCVVNMYTYINSTRTKGLRVEIGYQPMVLQQKLDFK